jgi:DNA replication and repair protein RecF
MAILQLEIDRLRNLHQIKIEPVPGFNFIIGDNGSGKTSVLEAIHCLGRGKSFRSHKTNKLIQHGCEAFTVIGHILQKGHKQVIGMERTTSRSQIRVSGRPIRSTTELIELLPIAVLEPGLHRLVEEGPEFRRKFLDWGVFHVEPAFNTNWKQYSRALAQRNAALRDRWAKIAVKQWDRELALAATELDQARRAYLETLRSFMAKTQSVFSALPEVAMNYHPGWREGTDYLDYLDSHYESDRDRGFTQFGPHRADIKLKVNGVDTRDVLSRGQQKLLVANLILSQCRYLQSHDTSAVILVDDLPAELDTYRRRELLQALQDTGAQVFVTGTEKALFEGADFSQAGLFHVEHGSLKRLT